MLQVFLCFKIEYLQWYFRKGEHLLAIRLLKMSTSDIELYVLQTKIIDILWHVKILMLFQYNLVYYSLNEEFMKTGQQYDLI